MKRVSAPSASMALLLAAAAVAWTGLQLSGQTSRGTAPAASSAFVASTAKGDWPSYTGDTRGTRYSPLAQITAENFNDLEVAWILPQPHRACVERQCGSARQPPWLRRGQSATGQRPAA